MVKIIDNKLITLQTTAGYSVEPVVCLWYEQKSEERTKNMANNRRPQGDVCDRCLWQMKGAKRSGSNLGCGEQTTDCDGRALVTTGDGGNYGK